MQCIPLQQLRKATGSEVKLRLAAMQVTTWGFEERIGSRPKRLRFVGQPMVSAGTTASVQATHDWTGKAAVNGMSYKYSTMSMATRSA